MNNKLPFLIEESLGKQWYFSISDKKQLYYKCRNNDKWSEPAIIGSQVIRDFSACIDKNDKIYLFTYTYTKQLHYYEWDGYSWLHRTLLRVSSRFEDIAYINALVTPSQIHLFYYIENSLKRSQESLMHYCLELGEWKKVDELSFLSDQQILPKGVFTYAKNDLIFIYTKKQQKLSQCYLTKYQSNTWSSPYLIFQSYNKINDINNLIESLNIIHLVWIENNGSNFNLNYSKINIYKKNDINIKEKELIYSSSRLISYPVLVKNNKLYCYWLESDKGYASMLDEESEKWCSPALIEKSPSPYIHIVKALDGSAKVKLTLKDGSHNFKSLLDNSLDDTSSIVKSLNNAEVHDTEAKHISSSSNLMDKNFIKELKDLKKQLDNLTSTINDLYTALYQLQDHMQERDKSIYQIDTTIKRLSFELGQFKNKNMLKGVSSLSEEVKGPINADNTMNAKDNKKDNDDSKNIKHSQDDKLHIEEVNDIEGNTSKEIILGNVSILINPDSEE